MGGNLNCPLNPITGKRGSNLIPRQAVINTIELLQSEQDLHDICDCARENVPKRLLVRWAKELSIR